MSLRRNQGDPETPALAHRLETIISAYYRTKKRPSYKEMAKEIEQATGRSFSSTYLWELATGRKDNVTADHLHTLAEFFGVTRDYFTDPEISERVRRQMEFAVALGNGKVRILAARADRLSEAHLEAILAAVNALSNDSTGDDLAIESPKLSPHPPRRGV